MDQCNTRTPKNPILDRILSQLQGVRKTGSGWTARCPSHDDRHPSLSVRIGVNEEVIFHCFSSCSWDQIRLALGVSISFARPVFSDKSLLPPNTPGAACRIWKEIIPPAISPVERYLKSRGLEIPVPPDLRFHPRLKHPSGSFWPALVAAVRNAGGILLGIHRIFLTHEGTKAPVEPVKMSLGPIKGGTVRLAEAEGEVVLCEGIETGLSVLEVLGKPVWACLSTSGLKAVLLPEPITTVWIAADGDPPGENAARECAQRLVREGRTVRIARPPAGHDFNDLLRGPREE